MTNQESNEAKASELNNRGYELAEAGRWQEAIAYYQEALHLNPRHVHSLTNMGNALRALGRLPEALAYQDKALAIDPDSSLAWANKAVILAGLNRRPEAIRCYDRSLEIDPSNKITWFNKGVALFSIGRKSDAIQCLDHILENIDSGMKNALGAKAEILQTEGRTKEAAKCLERMKKIDAEGEARNHMKARSREDKMASQETCDRCGKVLRPGVGPDGPMHVEMTGETICGDCMMKMLEAVSPPVDDNFEVKEFARKAAAELAQITGVQLSSISVHCKQFMSYDVEINTNRNAYQIVLIYDLIEDVIRWRRSRDYIVSWISQHSLSRRTWASQTSANPNLVAEGRFVFIFLPEAYPQPPNDFGPRVAHELCRSVDASKIGWMVCPISKASQEYENQDVASALSTWARTQSQPDSLRFDRKKVKFHFSPDECTCIIVRR